jgi:hypothetical protein
MLCAGGSISMSMRLSRWTLLTGLAVAVMTLGPTIAAAQADVSDAANLYPGGHAARCIPAPIFGCVCSIDPSGEAVMFADLDSMADHHFKDDLADSEHSRMISWLRRTCESLNPTGDIISYTLLGGRITTVTRRNPGFRRATAGDDDLRSVPLLDHRRAARLGRRRGEYH